MELALSIPETSCEFIGQALGYRSYLIYHAPPIGRIVVLFIDG